MQTVEVHNHKERMISFSPQTLGFSKLLQARIKECRYGHLNLSALLNNHFAVV